MGFLARIFKPSAVKTVEGDYRDGPWYLPLTGGWLTHSVGQYMNWWQLGYNPVPAGAGPMVEACVGAYSQTVAMCPGDHWIGLDDGGRERVKTSALSRILRYPNDYQSISDFMLNATRSLYLQGNAFALALRNDRFEVSQFHLMDPSNCSARIAENGEVFYQLGGNEIVERMLVDRGLDRGLLNYVPARNVLHIKLHTPHNNHLIGESPILAAAPDILAASAMTRQQIAFYLNQARPSFILSTDQVLTVEQAKDLRAAWDAQSKGLASGGTPILTAGVKPHPISVSGKDSELATIMKLSDEHIALVFRIPLQILGIGPTPFASTEALMNSWIASGLGFALNHIEEALGHFFGLKGVPDEYIEFDTKVLLRSSMKERVEALAASVKGGIHTINEARREESLSKKKGGDEPRVQQQDVPLDWHEKEREAKKEAAKPPLSLPPPDAPAPAAPPPPEEAKDLIDVSAIQRRFKTSYARYTNAN